MVTQLLLKLYLYLIAVLLNQLLQRLNLHTALLNQFLTMAAHILMILFLLRILVAKFILQIIVIVLQMAMCLIGMVDILLLIIGLQKARDLMHIH